MHIDELVDLLNATGYRVTSDTLTSVANSIDEARFQLEDDEIRARHGHSIKFDIEYESGPVPAVLFHATSRSNMASILEARDGLKPRGRVKVHLTADPTIAMRAARRRGESVSLLELSARTAKGLGRSSEQVWVADEVKASAMHVVTPWEMTELLGGVDVRRNDGNNSSRF